MGCDVCTATYSMQDWYVLTVVVQWPICHIFPLPPSPQNRSSNSQLGQEISSPVEINPPSFYRQAMEMST